jgi:hypothetical protein
MIDDGIDRQLVPWQPVLGQRIGQRIAAVVRNVGGIEWELRLAIRVGPVSVPKEL